MARSDDTLLVGCRCCGFHFAQVYGGDDLDDPERLAYLTITAQPQNIRGRIKGAWRSLFGRSYYESAEVCVDRNGAVAMVDALNRATVTRGGSVRSLRTDEQRLAGF